MLLSMLPATFPPLATFGSQAFLAGVLVALALLAMLTYRSLGDRVLRLSGLFGLLVATTWVAFSGIAAALLPTWLLPAIHPASLVLGGISLAVWERMTSELFAASPEAKRLAPLRRLTALVTLAIALAAVIPWEPSHRFSELLLGLLAPALAVMTLAVELRARREGFPTAGPMVAATLALLVCCAVLWIQALGAVSESVSMALLCCSLALLAMALGWAVHVRMLELRKATEEARLLALARQAQELEALVAERNGELSARLNDLGEARRTAELANQGLQRALEQLEQAASTDRLTGAWNRRRFEEAVLPEIALAHRRRDSLSLIMFDLDHFKRVNDTYGHGAGDMVLVETAQLVRLHLRASDALVRWGGEEFLVLAPATRLDGAMALAEKLRGALAAFSFPDVGHVTMSLGAAEYAIGEGLAAWIERADKALYSAKTEGRNRAVPSTTPDGDGGIAPSGHSLLEVFWEDAYESGSSLIDQQHQRLFRLASALLSGLTGDRPLAEVSLRLETLLAHTAQHFHDEEALLRKIHFKELPQHAVIHASLLAKARKLQLEVQSGQLDFGKLVSFLALDLVKGHLLEEDKHYFGCLAGAKTKGELLDQ